MGEKINWAEVLLDPITMQNAENRRKNEAHTRIDPMDRLQAVAIKNPIKPFFKTFSHKNSDKNDLTIIKRES